MRRGGWGVALAIAHEVPVSVTSSLSIAPARPLGTMVTFGYPAIRLEDELSLAVRLGASVLEILPAWTTLPDPAEVRARAADAGLSIHSAHGCWGGQTIRARRVDLGTTDASGHRESVDDLKRCVDWLAAAGGKYLVVHPGGLSDPDDGNARRAALSRGLETLSGHARGAAWLSVSRTCRQVFIPAAAWPIWPTCSSSSINPSSRWRSTPGTPI